MSRQTETPDATGDESHVGTTVAARRRRRAPGVMLGAPGVALLAAFALADGVWAADVIANLAAQVMGLCVVAFVPAAARRRWVASAVLVGAIGACAWVMTQGRAPAGEGVEIRL